MTWPLCECGCGEPTATDRRSGRPARYAGREHSQRMARRLARKRATEIPEEKRRCMTCRVFKPFAMFSGPAARRCNTCRHRAKTAPCIVCGDLAGEAVRGYPRKICDKPACRSALSSKNRKTVIVLAAREREALKTKRCPNCERRKPATLEHWAPGGMGFDGKIRLDSYCRPCRAALSRDRARNPETRARTRESGRKKREQLKARRAADPVFDAQFRAKRREWERKSRAKRKALDAAGVPAVEHHHPGGVQIPALPLAVFIEREVSKTQNRLNGHAPAMDTTLEKICMKFGIASRRLREWREQPGCKVSLDVADRVITNADRLWFDIYDAELFPVEHQLAALAFEGC
jgi:hypothetical protein